MSVYQFEVETVSKETKALADYQGQVLLLVNTASKCGFTPQLAGLEELYKDYQEDGLEILGFPCNQFLGQDPKTSEDIVAFCQLNYGVSFPIFEKINVRGKNQAPLFKYLISETGGKSIPWNFTKFLIDREGNVVKRYTPKTEPKEMTADILTLLSKNSSF